jgi:tripartite-type tricarboxylate transporter receptor subunit TctC
MESLRYVLACVRLYGGIRGARIQRAPPSIRAICRTIHAAAADAAGMLPRFRCSRPQISLEWIAQYDLEEVEMPACPQGRRRNAAASKFRWTLWPAALLAAAPAWSGESPARYPTKPIRMIVPLAAGGTTDIVARIIAQRFTDGLGQPVVVDNRTGGGTTIGAALVARAAPDGYTLLFHSVSLATTVPLYKLPYDATKDFVGVSPVGQSFYVAAVHPTVPVQTIQELIALARSKPKQIAISHAGTGTITHLAVELFMANTKTQFLLVPFKGGNPALQALLGGQVQAIFNPIAEILPMARAGGKVRTLAVTAPKRTPELPEVPTLAEAGYPGATVTTINGVYAPAGTPNAIIERLNAEVNRAVQTPEVQERFRSQGLVALGGTPAQLTDYLRTEIVRWTKVVKDAGIKVE